MRLGPRRPMTRPLPRKLGAALLLMLLSVGSAAADLRIRAMAGGRIGDYLKLFALVRASGQRVVIDGPCLSACTLVLSVVPGDRICTTPKAVLGFHAPWLPDARGRKRSIPQAGLI